jgi:hypothetical protein
MSTYYVYADERYPVYDIDEETSREGNTIELTTDELNEYKRACSEYYKWQDRLEAACK